MEAHMTKLAVFNYYKEVAGLKLNPWKRKSP